MKQTITGANEQFAKGKLSSTSLIGDALARIADPIGEGRLVFTQIYADDARQAAAAADATRSHPASPIAGLPISIKDLFDVQGEVTLAGSKALVGREPAAGDAEIVNRLKRAGAVIVGRTNMSEFAFTGVGMNPHFGTPANPYDRQRRRIPGGSSSGAPVSVSDGMALAAIGTDTGGSVRIPAALCGLAGFKPTQRRVPRDRVFPLSQTLDSVGVIAHTVSCCAEVDAILAGENWKSHDVDLKAHTFGLSSNYFLDDLEKPIARAFERAVSKLSAVGARVVDVNLPEMEQIAAVNARGGISAPEAYAYHRRLGTDFELYDPLVRERILRGKEISAAEYLDMLHVRGELIRTFNSRREWDLIITPTVPIVAPEIAALEKDADLFRRTNRLLLRNPSVVNFLDGCSLSIPCHQPGDAPAGLMLIGRALDDTRVLNIGRALERILEN